MFQFTVQAAKHKNVDAVCRISNTVLNSGLPHESLKKLYFDIIQDVEQIIMIAVNSGHTVGFAHARRVKDLVCGCYAELVTIALLPYYQRRGGGTSLMFGIEQWSRQMLTGDLRCFPKTDDPAVDRLLEGCGYIQNSSGVFEKTLF